MNIVNDIITQFGVFGVLSLIFKYFIDYSKNIRSKKELEIKEFETMCKHFDKIRQIDNKNDFFENFKLEKGFSMYLNTKFGYDEIRFIINNAKDNISLFIANYNSIRKHVKIENNVLKENSLFLKNNKWFNGAIGTFFVIYIFLGETIIFYIPSLINNNADILSIIIAFFILSIPMFSVLFKLFKILLAGKMLNKNKLDNEESIEYRLEWNWINKIIMKN